MDGNGPFGDLRPPAAGEVGRIDPEEWCGLAQDKGKRVYQLAKELNVESKELLDFCKELGYDIKNQLSNLTGDQVSPSVEVEKTMSLEPQRRRKRQSCQAT